MLNWDELQQLTNDHMANPQVGDMFQEMYSFWVKVVERSNDQVKTLEGNDTLIKQWSGTVEEFQKRFAYGSIPGYSLSLYVAARTQPEGSQE